MKLRVKFRKYGPIRFIGHLDLMRFFQKAIRRAGIDVAYSGGFSPHQIMSFASPLGVGLESNGEYMDIEVNSLNSCEDVKQRLNQASIPGIEVVSVGVLPEAAGNAMASVAAASYTVRFRGGREPQCLKELLEMPCGAARDAGINSLLDAFLEQGQILIIKEGKKNAREVDLRPGIYEFTWRGEQMAFFLLLNASSAGNIKPAQVFEAFVAWQGSKAACKLAGEASGPPESELPENSLLITREELFMLTGGDSAGKPMRDRLIPLEAAG